MQRQFIELGIDEVREGNSPRIDDGDLTDLENSITRFGVLSPLIVGRNNVLIAGARRLRACRNLGIGRIPVLKVEADEGSPKALDIVADENLCRLPLSAEEVDNLERMQKLLAGNRRSPLRKVAGQMRRMFSRRQKASPGA